MVLNIIVDSYDAATTLAAEIFGSERVVRYGGLRDRWGQWWRGRKAFYTFILFFFFGGGDY